MINHLYHEWTNEHCPHCGRLLIRVKETGFLFCSNSQLVCDYEIQGPVMSEIERLYPGHVVNFLKHYWQVYATTKLPLDYGYLQGFLTGLNAISDVKEICIETDFLRDIAEFL
jgi:hypothetical protein